MIQIAQQCLSCKAPFSGERNEVCGTCQRRLRLESHCDPITVVVWKRHIHMAVIDKLTREGERAR